MADPSRDPLAAPGAPAPIEDVKLPFGGQAAPPAPVAAPPAPVAAPPPAAGLPPAPNALVQSIPPIEEERELTVDDLEGPDENLPTVQDFLANTPTEPSTLEEAIGVLQGGASGISRGVTAVLGIPVDLTNFTMRQLDFETQLPGGSDDLRALAESGPTAVDQETADRIRLTTGMRFFENVGETVGGAAALVKPMAATARALGGEGSKVSRFLKDMGVAEKARPAATFNREIGIGAAAGTAGATSLAIDPGNNTNRLISEIVGGFSAGGLAAAGPKIVKVMPARILIRTWRRMRGKRPNEVNDMAAKVVQDLAAQGEGGVAGAVRGIDEAAGLGMSPAAASGNPELMALERSVISSYRALGPKFKAQADQVEQTLSRELVETAGAPPSGINSVADVLSARHKYLTDLMEERIKVATELAQQRIEKLGSNVPLSVANKTIRSEIDKAMKAVQVTEREVWGKVDMTAQITPTETETIMEGIIRGLAGPEKVSDFIPPRLQIWLGRIKKVDGVDTFVPGRLSKPGQNNIGNLDALRKQIGQGIRNELGAPAPNNNKVRILTQLDEALLKDAGPGAGEDLKAAIDFSRDVSNRFRKGTVGQIRGIRNASGTVMIDPALTVDSTISRFGGVGRLSAEQILEAVREAPDTTRVMVQRVLREAFATRFVKEQKDGTLGVSARDVEAFIRKNGELFDMFPQLREEFKDIASIQATVKREVGRRAHLMTDAQARKRAKAGMLLGEADAGNIADLLRSPNPGHIAAEMVKQLRKADPSGEALQGLGAEYLHGMLTRSSSGMAGAKKVNGASLSGLIEQEDGVLRHIFSKTPGAINRLKRIAGQFRNQEAALKEAGIRGGLESVSQADALSMIVGRVLGARIGAMAGGASGGGSIQAAGLGSSLAKRWIGNLGLQRLQDLLVEATQDPKLMRALLIQHTSNTAVAVSLKPLRAWAVAAGIEFNKEGLPVAEAPSGEVRARPPAVISEEDFQ